MIVKKTLVTWSFLLLFISGCEQSDIDQPDELINQQITLRFGHDLPVDTHQHIAALRFAEEVSKKSNNQLKIEIFADQVLGTDRQMVAMAQRGELDFVLPPTAKLSHLIPAMQVFDLPFLFPDEKAAHKALDGKAGKILLSQFDKHNLLGVTIWESGFKQLTTNKPIADPDDFIGTKYRIMESNVIRDQFANWGAESIAIDFGRTYEALKNKIVDGQENPLNSIVNKRFYEVQDYLYLSEHGYLAQVFVMSLMTFNKLSKRHQQIILESAKNITSFQRTLSQQSQQDLLAYLETQSLQISHLSEKTKAALQSKSKSVLESYRMQFGTELIEEILQTVDEGKNYDDDQLVIAIDADMSGNSALSGLAIRRGIEIAIDEINQAGGVLGKSLVVTARDNSMIPARGLSNLKKFSSIKNLVAVFGGISSPVLLEELDYLHKNKMLTLVPWAAATAIVDNGYSPNYIFRVSVRDEYAADFLSTKALDISSKIGLLLVDNAWGRSNHEALTETLKNRRITPTQTEWFEWGKKDFSGKIKSLYDTGSEVIIYVGNPVEASKIIQQLSQYEKPIPIVSHWGITGGNFPTLTGESLKKVDLRVLQTFSFIDNKSPNVKVFVEKYKEKYFIDHASEIVAPVGTAHAYDLTHMLAKAIKKAGSKDPHKIRNALETIGHHSGLVKDYSQPFTADRHDALNLTDFILTKYQDNYLVPFETK